MLEGEQQAQEEDLGGQHKWAKYTLVQMEQ